MKAYYEFPIRLQKFLANSSTLSRRKAEDAIAEGRVEINGNIVTEMGVKVEKGDRVFLDGVQLSLYSQFVVYMLNKPRGAVCTNYDPHQTHYAKDFIQTKDHDSLFSVGRLDKNSEGLILFTNDGAFADRVTHPSNKIRKYYSVNVKEKLLRSDLEAMTKGIVLDDSPFPYKLDSFSIVSAHWVEVVLTSGKNREIRKLFEHFGYNIDHLVRFKIGNLDLGDLKEGSYRKLNGDEIKLVFGENS